MNILPSQNTPEHFCLLHFFHPSLTSWWFISASISPLWCSSNKWTVVDNMSEMCIWMLAMILAGTQPWRLRHVTASIVSDRSEKCTSTSRWQWRPHHRQPATVPCTHGVPEKSSLFIFYEWPNNVLFLFQSHADNLYSLPKVRTFAVLLNLLIVLHWRLTFNPAATILHVMKTHQTCNLFCAHGAHRSGGKLSLKNKYC